MVASIALTDVSVEGHDDVAQQSIPTNYVACNLMCPVAVVWKGYLHDRLFEVWYKVTEHFPTGCNILICGHSFSWETTLGEVVSILGLPHQWNISISDDGIEVCVAGCPVHQSVGQSSDAVPVHFHFPDKHRAKVIFCNPKTFVLDTLAMYVHAPNAPVRVTVTCNGKIISPNTCHTNFLQGEILRCQWEGLLGGGKRNEELVKKVADLLQSHGVPVDHTASRANQIMEGIGVEKLIPHQSDDEINFWNVLKRLATDAKVRLVTQHELKDFQKAKRMQLTNKLDQGASSTTKDAKTVDIDPSKLRFDMVHFQAEGQAVELLDSSRFGPDQSGLVIIQAKHAKQLIPSKTISADPLALLVIGNGAKEFGTLSTYPAYNGDVPVLVPGVLVQCGDEQIRFVAATPAASASTVPATTVEFQIRRKYVKDWSQVMTPLNYIGIQCPELRGPNKIHSSWSIRSFKGRSPTPHEAADSYHGYLKIPDSLLEPILKRSGLRGLFWTPKSIDKKPDPRFAIVQMPMLTHDQVIQRVGEVKDALGIAIVGDQDRFAIRCKREHLNGVRQELFPESVQLVIPDFQNLSDGLGRPTCFMQGISEPIRCNLFFQWFDREKVIINGKDSWLVASSDRPPADHLCINQALVVVIPHRKSVETPVVLTRADQTTQVMERGDGAKITTTHSRIDEIKANLEVQIVEAVEARMEAKLQHATNKYRIFPMHCRRYKPGWMRDMSSTNKMLKI